MKRDSFIFYRSFYEAISELSDNDQLQIYKSIADYSLNFKEPELTGISKTIFILIKPQLDANNKRYLNGTQPKNKQNRSKTEAKQKQDEIKTEANKNVNDNDNKKEIYKDFLNSFNGTAKRKFRILSDKTKRQINARLKEGFTIKDIILATENCYNDDYHKKNRHYLTPEFITRSDKLQKYILDNDNNGFTHVEYTFAGQSKIIKTIEYFKSKEKQIRSNQFDVEPKYIKQ